MRIFAVLNSSSYSDFELNDDFKTGGSNAHSGGVVVIAENEERARELILAKIKLDDDYDWEEGTAGTLKEIILDKEGLLLFADGNC